MTETLQNNQSLEQAMQVFWQNGYEGTNFNQLVSATGLSRKAIYKNWQDKRGLFAHCLGFYSAYMAKEMLAPLQNPNSTGLPALSAFFQRFEQMLDTNTPLFGCLVVKTVSEFNPQDAEITSITHNFLQTVKDSLHASLTAAQQQHQLKQGANIEQATEFLFAIHVSFGSLSGNAASHPLLKSMIAQALLYLDQLKQVDNVH